MFTNPKLSGEKEYKGYKIVPQIVCYNIRYFVYGGSFHFSHYESYFDAEKAIDRDIAKLKINAILDSLSTTLDIDKSLMCDVLLETLVENSAK